MCNLFYVSHEQHQEKSFSYVDPAYGMTVVLPWYLMPLA
jgi:hypothetical protein